MSSNFQLLALSALLGGQVAAPPAGVGRGFQQYGPPREVTVTAIPGVIEAVAKWTKVWRGDGRRYCGH